MGTWRTLILLLIVWSSLSDTKKVSKPKPKTPVYFPISPEDFKSYGVRIPSPVPKAAVEEFPSTTAKSTTTTMRLPIAQKSHVAPKEDVTRPPGPAYLTDSSYYIPSGSTDSPRGYQDLSGLLTFGDDDRERGSAKKSSVADLLSQDSTYQDQERFGIFFIGEHESFGGSEEHFDRVPFNEGYIPPTSFEEQSDVALQSLPQRELSSHSEQSHLSVELPSPSVYESSRQTSSRFIPSSEASERRQPASLSYGPPKTDTIITNPSPTRNYVAPRLSTTTLASVTTRRTTTTRRRYPSTTTTQKPYTRPESRRYTAQTTTTPKPYLYTRPAVTTPRPTTYASTRSRNRYTAPPTTTTTPRSYVPETTTASARPNYRYRQPTAAAAATHAVYFKPDMDFKKTLSETSSSSSPSTSTSYRAPPVRKTISRRPLTIKGISVQSSSSSSLPKPVAKPATLPRVSSTYKNPFLSKVKESEEEKPRYHEGRAGSKYQAPVYTTSDKSFQAPSSLYQGTDSNEQDNTRKHPEFIKAADNIYIPQEYDESSIPGEAGINYPVHSEVPETPFSCEDQKHPGLYADTDADCQVFHICQKSGQHDSFLCPNGTVFNQQYFVCDWWYNFACNQATEYFGLNEFIYELPDEKKYN